MDVEGMVHALQKTRQLLQPEGILVTFHDLPTPQRIEVHTGQQVHKPGWLSDKDGFSDTLAALDALAQVVSDREYTLEAEEDFEYRIYMESLNELHTWMSKWWSNALLTERVAQQLADQLHAGGPDSRIVLVFQARITRLKVACQANEQL